MGKRRLEGLGELVQLSILGPLVMLMAVPTATIYWLKVWHLFFSFSRFGDDSIVFLELQAVQLAIGKETCKIPAEFP